MEISKNEFEERPKNLWISYNDFDDVKYQVKKKKFI